MAIVGAESCTMPPDHQHSRPSSNIDSSQGRVEAWPTEPGSTSAHIQIPDAPTMSEIRDACVAAAVYEGEVPYNENNNNPQNIAAVTATFEGMAEDFSSADAVAVAVVEVEDETARHECTVGAAADAQAYYTSDVIANATFSGTCEMTQSSSCEVENPNSIQQPAAVALPSRFMGYMDEKGIIHEDKQLEGGDGNGDNNGEEGSMNEKRAAFLVESRNTSVCAEEEEEKAEIPDSAEDVFQASLHFERSHPEKRFSSSLDHYYSTSIRQLYPSLEDVTEPPLAKQSGQMRQESMDSVRTTCEDVVASAASPSVAAAAAAASVEAPVVPEPPGASAEAYAVASVALDAACQVDHGCDDEDDVKIGVAKAGMKMDRTETESPEPTYAVASIEGFATAAASAEATVMGTGETPEEALLAKLAAEDAELLAMKRSAYGGGGGPQFPPSATFPDQQATVVAITEHDVHPSDISNDAVQAELIGEDYQDVTAATASSLATSSHAATPSHASAVASAATTHAAYAVEEPGYTVVDSEATIIDGGASWQGTHAEEATVLNDEESSVPYSDRKLPAVSTTHDEQQWTPPRDNRYGQNAYASADAAAVAVQQEQAEVVAMSEPGYDSVAYYSDVAYADEQAEVVGVAEEFHPAEVSGDEAQAELIAEDYGAAAAFATESMEGQAEVVGITEEFHPAEVSGSEARAELVGEDYGAAVALPSNGIDEHAEVVGITEDFHPAEISGNEAEAELVAEDYGAAVALPSGEGESVQATPLSVDEVGAVQAATVVGYEDDDDMASSPGVSRASSCGTPIRDAISSPPVRAYSAPSAVGTRVDVVGTPLTQATTELDTVVEEDWMRTPSIAGDSSAQGIVVMKPPIDDEDDGPPAVAVAALDAYAEAPTPTVDDTSCCSPATPAQPVVAAAALSADASAPAPAFDETDCSLVNRQPIQPEVSASITSASEPSSNQPEPSLPPPRSFNSLGGTSDAGSVGSATSMSTSTTRGGFQKISNSFARGMEMLFGDSKTSQGRRGLASDNNSLLKSVMSRQLLPWSVIYSEATNMWVATVNTNQKALDSKNVVEASKSLRAFSVVTEKQATCLAKAWSPPRMHDFGKNKACHICKAKFAVFRRACHCRNCGVAICVSSNGCSRPWPAKMCPETYNIKKESFLNVCAACDFLCTSFRLALLDGDRDKAIALHATGNINIVTPFANVKGELFYPVHCAALGGNLELLKWLVDENCCPIKSVRVSGRCRDSSNSFTEISTSKGRSLLGIALENRNVGIVRYLVVEKGIQLAGEKDITMDTLCRNLEVVLRLLPEDAATGNGNDPALHHEVISDEQAPLCGAGDADANLRALDTASDGSVSDACIICFDRSIDCVATPCGHQVCCLDCSSNIAKCPVCSVDCSFMRVFRP